MNSSGDSVLSYGEYTIHENRNCITYSGNHHRKYNDP